MPVAFPAGAKVVCPDGEAPRAFGCALDAARALEDKLPLHHPPSRPAVREVALELEAESGTVDVYCEYLYPPVHCVIVGAGHIARPLARMAAALGWKISVADDRADFAAPEHFPEGTIVHCAPFTDVWQHVAVDRFTAVVLVTRGHRHDAECLAALKGAEPFYVGLIGSQRRVQTTLASLRSAGVEASLLERVYGPIGLPLAGDTPGEIALAVAAEIVSVKCGRGTWVKEQKSEYYRK
jgi:xanthine dehydrogenase accessory factor